MNRQYRHNRHNDSGAYPTTAATIFRCGGGGGSVTANVDTAANLADPDAILEKIAAGRGLTLEELAACLGLTVAGARFAEQRALRRLRWLLQGESRAEILTALRATARARDARTDAAVVLGVQS